MQKSSKQPQNEAEDQRYLARLLLQESSPLPGRHVLLWYKHAAAPATRNASFLGQRPSASGSGTGVPAALTPPALTETCMQGPPVPRKDSSAVTTWDSAIIGIIGQAEADTV